jgi:hypothetical protein
MSVNRIDMAKLLEDGELERRARELGVDIAGEPRT